jgi:hypothetical protein
MFKFVKVVGLDTSCIINDIEQRAGEVGSILLLPLEALLLSHSSVATGVYS